MSSKPISYESVVSDLNARGILNIPFAPVLFSKKTNHIITYYIKYNVYSFPRFYIYIIHRRKKRHVVVVFEKKCAER